MTAFSNLLRKKPEADGDVEKNPPPPSAGSGSSGGSLFAGGGGAGAGGKGGKGKVVLESGFDPTALERGVEAMKTLDKSPYAKEALELSLRQETTKQLELQAQIENQKAFAAKAGIEAAHAEGEEKRKTLEEQHKQEQRSAHYRANLEKQLAEAKRKEELALEEQKLQKQHEAFLRQEELRKQNERELQEERRRTMLKQAELDRESSMMKIQAESESRVREERQNEDVRTRMSRAQAEEKRHMKVEQIRETFTQIGRGAQELLTDQNKMLMLVGGVTAMALGVFTAKNGTAVVARFIEARIGKPSLVRETSRFTWQNKFKALFGSKEVLDGIVLEPSLKQRLTWLSTAAANTKKNKAPFRHVLLSGPPGTGKTLFAKSLAYKSGLDYAIMTGADVSPLGRDAVTEMHRLFDWANTSRRGLLIFIDEADAFLRKGRESDKMSEDMRNVLSSFLYRTGTESNKFMFVLATNKPGTLDNAIMDRVDEAVEFPLPSEAERLEMLVLFFDQYIIKRKGTSSSLPITAERFTTDNIKEIAAMTEGMSGRQLAKIVIAIQAACFAQPDRKLTPELASTVVKYKIEQFKKQAALQDH